MNELQLKIENLKNRIPKIYGNYIDVDEGWYQIVIDCDNELLEIDANYIPLQIKQKFGTLRYYVEPSIPGDASLVTALNSITSKYEALSTGICEATGLKGVLMKSPNKWYRTLDPNYAESKLHYEKYSIVEKRPTDEEWWDAIR